MADPNNFAGQISYIPSVNINVNTSALVPQTIGSPLVPCLMGIAQGGIPNTATTIYTTQQAMTLLRGGDLLDAVLRCFQPSDLIAGPTKIIVIRANPATQATGTLLDGSAGNTILLTSANYGALDNNLSVNIAAGTTTGKKVTVVYNGTGSNPGTAAQTFVGDNIIKTEFSLLYIGAGSTATATISETTLTTTTSIGGAENLNIALANFPTVQQLVNYINTTYSALYTAVVLTSSPGDPTAAGLDHITTQTIKTTPYNVSGNVNAIIAFISSTGLITATRAPSTTGLLPTNQTIVLTGGAEGSTDTTAWTNAINTAANQPVDIEVVLSGSSTIWGLLSTSISSTSVQGLNARRGLVGSSLGQTSSTLTTQLANVVAINNDRIGYIGQGITDINPLTGLSTTFAAYIYAAQLAGLICGTPFGNSITFEEVKGTALEWNPTTSDLQSMISGGILASQFAPVFNYVRVVRGISTWLKDNNFFRVELATGIAVDKVVKDLTIALQPIIGDGINQFTLYRVQSQTDSTLRGEISAGLVVGPVPPITVTGAGDVITVAFTAAFIIPANFINVNVTAGAFSGVLTSQVAA